MFVTYRINPGNIGPWGRPLEVNLTSECYLLTGNTKAPTSENI